MNEKLNELSNDFNYLESVSNEVPNDSERKEWLKERLGNVTGSNFGKLVKKNKDGSFFLSKGQVAKNLIYKIAWERLLKNGNVSEGLGRLEINSKILDHGLTFEGDAIKLYSQRTGNEVNQFQKFMQYSEMVGGTPDGLIGEEGLIEVKCPWSGGNHLQTLLEGVPYNDEYLYQMQGYMMITGRKWCDFVTYDPDLIDELQLSVTRIERDEEIIQGIKLVIDEVVFKIKEIIKKIEHEIT